MRLMALGLLMISLPAFACPNLAGTYATCRSVSGNSSGANDLVVTQAIQNRATVYTFTSSDAGTQERESETYRADDKTNVQSERDPDSGMTLSLATTVSCIGNKVQAKMVLTYGRDVLSTLTTTIGKAGNTLTQVVKGVNMGDEINETVICE